VRVLLDTNAFLRLMDARPLPRSVERLLKRPQTECLVSIVTGWEVVMKSTLHLRAADVEAGINEMGAAILPIRFAHLNELYSLPFYENHRDPFDRMLIAQALAEDVSIISSDMRFHDYKRLRIVWD
jgi:PIN domain nuclease of toxin-antitoxin system